MTQRVGCACGWAAAHPCILRGEIPLASDLADREPTTAGHSEGQQTTGLKISLHPGAQPLRRELRQHFCAPL
eukprot:5536670-Prymnesium_polylepis.1